LESTFIGRCLLPPSISCLSRRNFGKLCEIRHFDYRHKILDLGLLEDLTWMTDAQLSFPVVAGILICNVSFFLIHGNGASIMNHSE